VFAAAALRRRRPELEGEASLATLLASSHATLADEAVASSRSQMA
jgi:hypothetical protein